MGKTDSILPPHDFKASKRLVENRSCADFLVRAMDSPKNWWADLEASLAGIDQTLSKSGKSVDGDTFRAFQKKYRLLLMMRTKSERQRIAGVIRSADRYRIPIDFIAKAARSGAFNDPLTLSLMLRKATLPVKALWIELDWQPATEDNVDPSGKSGFLVERVDPEDGTRWIVSMFTGKSDGTIAARPYASAFDTEGVLIDNLPDPYELILPIVNGLPHSFVYAGLGKLDNDKGMPSFAVPSGFEDAFALSPLPLYQNAVGKILDGMAAQESLNRQYDHAFMRSIVSAAGWLQGVLPVLITLNELEHHLEESPSVRPNGLSLRNIVLNEDFGEGMKRIRQQSRLRGDHDWIGSSSESNMRRLGDSPFRFEMGVPDEEEEQPVIYVPKRNFLKEILLKISAPFRREAG